MRLTLGRYIPYNSIIHKMDPRLKLLGLIFLIVSIFLKTHFTGYVLIIIVVYGLYFTAKLKAINLFKISKPIMFMFVILFIVNCFLIKAGAQYSIGAHWGGGGASGGVSWFVVSEAAVYQSLYLCIRIYIMITITTILTGTTRPLDLTLAIEDLLSPLKLVKFPVHILSIIISIALRMIPTLIDEAGRIMKAQASRGIDFKNGKIKEKVKASVSLIIPLLVSAFQKAEDLAYAMDARGYNPKSPRTRYRKYKINWKDILIFLIMTAVMAILIAYSITNFWPYTISYLDKFIHV